MDFKDIRKILYEQQDDEPTHSYYSDKITPQEEHEFDSRKAMTYYYTGQQGASQRESVCILHPWWSNLADVETSPSPIKIGVIEAFPGLNRRPVWGGRPNFSFDPDAAFTAAVNTFKASSVFKKNSHFIILPTEVDGKAKDRNQNLGYPSSPTGGYINGLRKFLQISGLQKGRIEIEAHEEEIYWEFSGNDQIADETAASRRLGPNEQNMRDYGWMLPPLIILQKRGQDDLAFARGPVSGASRGSGSGYIPKQILSGSQNALSSVELEFSNYADLNQRATIYNVAHDDPPGEEGRKPKDHYPGAVSRGEYSEPEVHGKRIIRTIDDVIAKIEKDLEDR